MIAAARELPETPASAALSQDLNWMVAVTGILE